MMSYRPPDSQKIKSLFDRIAKRYDFLNSVLSFGLDAGWRKAACSGISKEGSPLVLDLGTGTGELSKVCSAVAPNARRWGLDFSAEMLSHARHKAGVSLGVVQADFHALPFANDHFDAALSSFTLRSVKCLDTFFSEILRVLKPGGSLTLLCLTRPGAPLVRFFHSLYLRYYIPVAGALFSGSREAYEFLAGSVQSFQNPEETVKIMRRAGFCCLRASALSLGICTLIKGEKKK